MPKEVAKFIGFKAKANEKENVEEFVRNDAKSKNMSAYMRNAINFYELNKDKFPSPPSSPLERPAA